MNQPLLYYADTGCHAARDALIVGRQPFRLIHGDPTDNTPLNKCLISETSIIEAIKFSNLALKLKAMKIFKSFFFTYCAAAGKIRPRVRRADFYLSVSIKGQSTLSLNWIPVSFFFLLLLLFSVV